uniref:BED-type domain-containing protein n=1 Tax=Globodera pallida TaxID=36090 RepID=A0A183CBQ7_GLOPA
MSDIWKYYDKSSANEAQCQICKRKLARKDGSTRGLWKHLEAKHQQDFQQLKGTTTDGEEEQRSLEVETIFDAK